MSLVVELTSDTIILFMVGKFIFYFREVSGGFLGMPENEVTNEAVSVPTLSVVEPQGPAVDESSCGITG